MDFGHSPPCISGASLYISYLFDGSNFNSWKKRMSIFIQSYDIELLKVIVHGLKISKNDDGILKKYENFNNEDWKS